MDTASSSLRDWGWFFPFNWQPEEPAEGWRKMEREKSDVSVLVSMTADETCALSKDIS